MYIILCNCRYYELLSFANDMDPLPSVTNLDSPHSEDCNLELVENDENETIPVFNESENDGKESTNQVNYVKHKK